MSVSTDLLSAMSWIKEPKDKLFGQALLTLTIGEEILILLITSRYASDVLGYAQMVPRQWYPMTTICSMYSSCCTGSFYSLFRAWGKLSPSERNGFKNFRKESNQAVKIFNHIKNKQIEFSIFFSRLKENIHVNCNQLPFSAVTWRKTSCLWW